MTEILIVDDEPLVLLTLRALCDWEAEGIHIIGEAQNGKAALEFIRKNPSVDIVLTDVDMPVMDGLELSEAIKAESLSQSMVFLSSYSNFEYVRRAFQSGAFDYILKSELEEKKLLGLILRIIAERADTSRETESDGGGELVAERQERRREAFFAEMAEKGESSIADIETRFADCGFSVTCPFHFMIIRPGDMPLVRKRYESNLFAFQKTTADLLAHFVPQEVGNSGAVSFDQYYVFMQNHEKMDKVFDLFYEAAWSYMDIGFERKNGTVVGTVGELQADFVSCLRDFVPPSRIVVRTRRYIREHFSDPEMNLSEIAEYTEVSKNHLSWEFNHETGETISDFIARTRIHEAKKLLLETNLRTYEVAEKTGYANVETFCRAFKKSTGTSPRQFS